MTAVQIVVALLMVAGLVGAALPAVPGTSLILAGALIHAVATDFAPVGIGRLAVLAVLALAGPVLAHAAGLLGARRAGGSRRAVLGALLGLVVGLILGPPGLIAGPVLGAVLGELSHGRPLSASVRAGLGSLAGLLAGIVAHVAVAALMVALFTWWVWRG